MEKEFKEESEIKTKSGFVAIIGLPNVGKSTLLNQILGTKVSVVSPKPQTTWFNIRGILTRNNYQIVFVDTPGIHDAKSLFNQLMVEAALNALQEVDVILWVIDVTHHPKEEEKILEIIKKANKSTILVLNKIDLIKKSELLPLIEYFAKLHEFQAIIPVSALKRDGLELVVEEIIKVLPEGPFYYEPSQVTDLPLKLFIAEVIREKIFLNTYQEVPYSATVKVDELREEPEKNLLFIQATIFIEKESQKGILIGKGGRMLKKIGTLAREELEFLLGKKVYLELWVKLLKGWKESEVSLKKVGFPIFERI